MCDKGSVEDGEECRVKKQSTEPCPPRGREGRGSLSELLREQWAVRFPKLSTCYVVKVPEGW